MPLEVRDPRHVWQLEFEGPWPTSVAFVGSPNRLVAGNRDGELLMWNLPDAPPERVDEGKKDGPPTAAPVRKLVGHDNGITHVLPLPDGRHVLTSSYDRTIRLWDVDAEPTGRAEVVVDLGKRRAAARKAKNDEPLNEPGIEVVTREAEHVFDGHGDWVLGLAIDADATRMLSGDDGGLVRVFDLPGRRERRRWQGHPLDGVVSTALSPDGATAFVSEYRASRGSFDRPPAMARLYDTESGAEKLDLLKIKFPDVKERDNSYGYHRTWSKWVGRGFVCSAFSPDGKLLAVGQGGEIGDAKVHLIDVETGKEVRTVSNHEYGVCDVAFSSDGKHVLTSGRDTTVKILNVADGKEIGSLGKSRGGQFKDWIHAIAISPDERRVAGADIAGMVHVWELAGK